MSSAGAQFQQFAARRAALLGSRTVLSLSCRGVNSAQSVGPEVDDTASPITLLECTHGSANCAWEWWEAARDRSSVQYTGSPPRWMDTWNWSRESSRAIGKIRSRP